MPIDLKVKYNSKFRNCFIQVIFITSGKMQRFLSYAKGFWGFLKKNKNCPKTLLGLNHYIEKNPTSFNKPDLFDN